MISNATDDFGVNLLGPKDIQHNGDYIGFKDG
jgi:hypothetical protein